LDMVQVSPTSSNLCSMSSLRILLVDNRDSFTWNLAHDLERHGAEVTVRQSADCATEDAQGFDGIVLSPGPGLPEESAGLMKLVSSWAPKRPILGVCLGLQALVRWSGGALSQMETVRHGVSSIAVRRSAGPLFAGLPSTFEVGHYHSWCAERATLPECWMVTAEVNGEPDLILGLRHKTLPLCGLQFHPESVLTPKGGEMLKAWLLTLRA
jgi:anthranilate synthase component 2